MSGGTSLEGSFTTDASGNLLTFDIYLSGGPFNGYLYQTGIATDVTTSAGPTIFEIANVTAGFIDLTLANPLSSGLLTDAVVSSEFNCVACGSYDVSGTSGEVAAVPEPSTWAMMFLGFLGVGLAMNRQRTKGAAALATV
jgi:hypothetical protein